MRRERAAPAMALPDCNGWPRWSSFVNCFFDPGWNHGEFENSCADCVIYRICDHSTHRDYGRFASSLRGRILIVQNVRFNLREP